METIAEGMVVLVEQNTALKKQITVLSDQVFELKRERAGKSSGSHKPQSRDGVGRRKSQRKPKKRSGLKPGGQLGHKGSRRAILRSDLVDKVADISPHACEL